MLHTERDRAESFGADAEQYDRSRPDYPHAMVERIVSATEPLVGAGSGAAGRLRVLDVGCGTGIAGRMFRDAGCDILGVEIDPRMAEVARRSGLDVEVAPFETWDSAGRIFDLLISGQAWHWVDPVGGAVKAASLLPAGGRVALFWNVGAPSPEVAEELNEVYRRLAPGLDDYSVLLGHGDPDRFVHGADGLRSTEQFSEPERWIFQWEREYSRAEWLDQLPTHSDHRSLDPERREVLLSAVGEVIDAMGGSFVMHYSAAVLTATRNA